MKSMRPPLVAIFYDLFSQGPPSQICYCNNGPLHLKGGMLGLHFDLTIVSKKSPKIFFNLTDGSTKVADPGFAHTFRRWLRHRKLKQLEQSGK